MFLLFKIGQNMKSTIMIIMIVMETIMILNNVNFDFLKLLGILGTIMLVVITPILIYKIYHPKIVLSKGFVITKKGYLRFKIQNQSKYNKVFDISIYGAYISKNITNRYNTQPICIPYLHVKSSKQIDEINAYERVITIQQLPKTSDGQEQNIRDFFNNGIESKETDPYIEIIVIAYDKFTSVKHSYSQYYHFKDVSENKIFVNNSLNPQLPQD